MPTLELDLGKVVITPYEAAQNAGYTGTEEEFDQALKSLDDSPFLPLAGGTMTGDIDMGANTVKGLEAPTNNDDGTNKGYVDDRLDALQEQIGTASAAIASAIEERGVNVPSNTPLSGYPAYISEINGTLTGWSTLPARSENTITVSNVPESATHILLAQILSSGEPSDGVECVPLNKLTGQDATYVDAVTGSSVYLHYDSSNSSVSLSTSGADISATHYKFIVL